MDRREKFKARSERLKRERKEKQRNVQQEEEAASANTLNVPFPKLSISGKKIMFLIGCVVIALNVGSVECVDVPHNSLLNSLHLVLVS